MSENCSIPGCDRPTLARGWCRKHYLRWYKHGDPTAVKLAAQNRPQDPIARFWAKVDATADCWIWKGTTTRDGYGRFSVNGRMTMAHRFSYELHVGPIPDGLELDHLCRTTSCVRPEHLQAVTGRTNTLRSTNPTAVNAAKTHCPQGHPYGAENTWTHNRNRKCKVCALDTQRRYRGKKGRVA